MHVPLWRGQGEELNNCTDFQLVKNNVNGSVVEGIIFCF